MYYEEKVIDGEWYYRIKPDGEWIKMDMYQTIQAQKGLLWAATMALRNVTNRSDPHCQFCGGQTLIEGTGHSETCIVSKCRRASGN